MGYSKSPKMNVNQVVQDLERWDIDPLLVTCMADEIKGGDYPEAVPLLRVLTQNIEELRHLLEDHRQGKVTDRVLVAVGSGMVEAVRSLYSSGLLDPFRSAIEDLFNKNTPVEQVSGSAEATVES